MNGHLVFHWLLSLGNCLAAWLLLSDGTRKGGR